MSAGIELDLDLSARIAGGVGQAVAEALAADRRAPRPKYPPGVIFPDTAAVVLNAGTPSPNWVGPLLGWAWRIFRLQISGAVSGPQLPSTPAVPASGVAVQNTNSYTVQVVLTGFTATQVFVNGIQVGTGNGTYVVPAAGAISVTYTVAGTWSWSAPGTSIGVYTVYRDSGQGAQDALLPAGAAEFTPNGVYEPHELYLRYPRKINAVGASVFGGVSGGLLVVDFMNIREDYLADYVA